MGWMVHTTLLLAFRKFHLSFYPIYFLILSHRRCGLDNVESYQNRIHFTAFILTLFAMKISRNDILPDDGEIHWRIQGTHYRQSLQSRNNLQREAIQLSRMTSSICSASLSFFLFLFRQINRRGLIFATPIYQTR